MDRKLVHKRDVALLERFLETHRPVLVLTGAGCGTASGIPAYRDHEGRRQHPPPVYYRDFTRSEEVRQRYWARAMVGWPKLSRAQPNPAYRTLAQLERLGYLQSLLTRNVDGPHRRMPDREELKVVLFSLE